MRPVAGDHSPMTIEHLMAVEARRIRFERELLQASWVSGRVPMPARKKPADGPPQRLFQLEGKPLDVEDTSAWKLSRALRWTRDFE
jgi:hypothetical protein